MVTCADERANLREGSGVSAGIDTDMKVVTASQGLRLEQKWGPKL